MGDFFLENERILASAQLMLAMFGMGAMLRIPDFVDVVRFPRGMLAGLATQLAAIPLLAVGVAQLFGLAPGLGVGLLVVASVPGGTMSNVFTYFARGHVPLSVSLTAATTVACLATTPFLLGWLAGSQLPDGFRMPVARIAYEIGVCLLGPLALGMLVGEAIGPERRQAVARWAIRASVCVILVMVVGAGAADRIDPSEHGTRAIAAIAAFTALAFAIGALACAVVGLPSPERAAVGIEAGFRNSSLALLVKAAVFPAMSAEPDPIADGVFFAILLYATFSFAFALVPVLWHRRLMRAGEPIAVTEG